jgi:hypothetical protein
MDALLLVGLLVLSGIAVVSAETTSWKLINVAVILGCILVGFGIGVGLEVGNQRLKAGAYIAVPFGIIVALECWRRNHTRNKLAILADNK